MLEASCADFLCDICGVTASTVCFVPRSAKHPRISDFSNTIQALTIGAVTDEFDRITITGFYADVSEKVEDETEGICKALHSVQPDCLFSIRPLWAPFYCCECKKSYCLDHWTTKDVFESEPKDWYERTIAKCPEGHERVIAE